MSAFRVFGVSFKQIHDATYKRARKFDTETIAQFDARIRDEAAQAFHNCTQLKAVSEKFDAPQFCQEFIDRAHPADFKHLTIRVNALTGEVVKGVPQRKWVKWEEGRKYVTSLGDSSF